MKFIQITILISVFLVQSVSVQAEDIDFPTVWKIISEKSHAQKATQLESEASATTQGRAARHWLPRLYIDIKGYQTNDPGSSFIGLIEQRAVESTDFSPDAINHPDQHFYTRGALGVDLPLFEGGIKVAEYKMQKHLATSKENEVFTVRNEQYSEVAKTYGSIAVLSEQKNKLLEMNKTLERLLRSYRLGVKSNPVGHSGLLGLKSLSNRLQGVLNQYGAQSEALYAVLNEMGLERKTDWNPKFENVIKYTQQFMASESYVESTSSKSMKEKALASKEVSGMERARFLPRLGAFAESYVFNGNRATANGYTAGLYLQWNLFNPTDFGALKESKLRAAAAENFAEAVSQKERAEYQVLLKSSESLRANIELLNDSDKIMTEQVQVTENLFKNGSVNALQFVEVLSRRVDLIISQTDAQLSHIKTEADKILKTHFAIPHVVEGKSL